MTDGQDQIQEEPAGDEIEVPVEEASPDGNEGRASVYPPLQEVKFAYDEPLAPFVERIAKLIPEDRFLLFTFPDDGGFQIHEKGVSIEQMAGARSWLDARILRYFSTEQQLAERRRAVARQGAERRAAGG